jgi:tRNA(Ile)-lysidine synthase
MAEFDCGIAHCNFKLRGAESDGDAEFVRKFAHELKVPFFEKEFETNLYAAENQLSIQQAARELRYSWFEQLISETGFDFYATAHHFDDQIETFFINLMRGTGVSGLRGIMPKNGRCVRPLLFASRTEIEDFAKAHKIAFREDSSNLKDDYLRNRIRHHLLPALESVKPDFRTGFGMTFNNLTQTEAFIKTQIEMIAENLISEEDGFWKIDLKLLQNQQPLPFILFELLKPFSFNVENVLMMADALGGISGKSFLSPTHKALLDRDHLLIFKRKHDEKHPEVFLVNENDEELHEPVELLIKKVFSNEYALDKRKSVAQLDLDKLKFPLQIRKPVTGDYFYPLGLGGRKKLSDFFTNEKFTAIQKLNTWLLLSEGEIAWVIGYRPDDRFKITAETKMVMKISLVKPFNGLKPYCQNQP